MLSLFHNFFVKVSRRECCEHRLLSGLTLMEHHNILNVPVFQKRGVTIYLQLVSLTIVMSLVHLSGMVYILGIFMPYIFNKDSRFVWLLRYFIDKIFEVFCLFIVCFVIEIILIKDDNAKSLRIRGLCNEQFNCRLELFITV